MAKKRWKFWKGLKKALVAACAGSATVAASLATVGVLDPGQVAVVASTSGVVLGLVRFFDNMFRVMRSGKKAATFVR